MDKHLCWAGWRGNTGTETGPVGAGTGKTSQTSFSPDRKSQPVSLTGGSTTKRDRLSHTSVETLRARSMFNPMSTIKINPFMCTLKILQKVDIPTKKKK